MAELSVEINGKMDGLQKALKDSEKALKSFEVKAQSISKSLAKNAISTSKLATLTEKLASQYARGAISQEKYANLTKRIALQNVNLSNKSKKLSSDLLNVNKAAKSLGGSNGAMGKLSKGAASGNSAMTAFSRTIQDAPFGIMGVSNNITNLTEQFGYLRNKTGSAKGALKAMLRDLKGFGGITLIISLVTSALLVFGDQLFKTENNTKKLNEQNKEFISGLKSLEKTLNSLSLSQDQVNAKIEDYILLQKIKSNADAQEEKSTKKLKKINEDLVKEKEKLSSAQNILKLNTIALGNAQDKEATRAKGYASGIARNNNLITQSTSKIKDLEKEKRTVILDSLSVLKKYREQRNKLTEAMEGSVSSLEQQKSLLEKEQKQVSKNSTTWKKYADEIKNVQNQINSIKGDIETSIITPDLKGIFTELKSGYKEGKAEIQELIETDPLVLMGDNNDQQEFQSIDWTAYANHKGLAEERLKVGEGLSMMVNATQLATNSIGQSFNQMTSGIKNNLTEQLGAMGSFLGVFVDFLSQMLQAQLQQFITEKALSAKSLAIETVFTAKKVALDKVKATSNAIVAATNTAAASGPASAILLPLLIGGAIAAIGSAFSGMGGGSNGGGVSGGTNTFSPSGTSSGGGSSGGGMQNVVFEIQGTKLVGVLSNTLARNRSLGGSLSLT